MRGCCCGGWLLRPVDDLPDLIHGLAVAGLHVVAACTVMAQYCMSTLLARLVTQPSICGMLRSPMHYPAVVHAAHAKASASSHNCMMTSFRDTHIEDDLLLKLQLIHVQSATQLSLLVSQQVLQLLQPAGECCIVHLVNDAQCGRQGRRHTFATTRLSGPRPSCCEQYHVLK